MKHANKVKRTFKYYSSAATARPGYLARRFEQIRRLQKEAQQDAQPKNYDAISSRA